LVDHGAVLCQAAGIVRAILFGHTLSIGCRPLDLDGAL
jgi:hypothetical protein